MADNKDAGLPPLQDPNTPDYVCPTCQDRVNSLCLACQELALLRANSTTNERDNSDSYTPQAMPDSDMSDSAYDADTIIDSPNSRSSTLKLNVSDSSNDETMLSDTNLNDEEIKEEPAPLMTRRRPLNQEEKLCVQRGCVCKCHGFKFGKGLSSDSDDTDRSDMPVLEGRDEDDGDKQPFINKLSEYIDRLDEEKEH